MLSRLEISQFRGLENVVFEGLGRANLIVGGNNTGKTSLLEALVLLLGNSAQVQGLPSLFREPVKDATDEGHHFWKLLVRKELSNEFRLSADKYSLKISVSDGRWFANRSGHKGDNQQKVFVLGADGRVGQGSFVSDFRLSILSTKQADPQRVSELYNQIAPLNPDNEVKIEELLRKTIEPRLRRLRYAKPKGTRTHLVYVDLGDGPMLPFTQLGQAFSRTLQVYCEIFASQPSVLLVDEIENGLYHEGLEEYWRGLLAILADQNVQLFATTHSRECMEAACRAAEADDPQALKFLRLDRRADDSSAIVATTFGYKEMRTAMEINQEMR